MRVGCRNVHYRYPGASIDALRGVDLTIEPGECIALLGQNGAGKSTLAKALIGLVRPSVGDIFINGQSLADLPICNIARHVGFVFQNPDDQLFKPTVREEIAFGARNLGRDSPAPMEEWPTVQATGLGHLLDENPRNLPLSDRKVVCIAAILAMETPLVVLDEPTAGQDAAGRLNLHSIQRALTEEGRSVLTVTHDMEFAVETADRIIIMADGHVHYDGPAETAFADENVLYVADLIPPTVSWMASHLRLPHHPRTVNDLMRLLNQDHPPKGHSHP